MSEENRRDVISHGGESLKKTSAPRGTAEEGRKAGNQTGGEWRSDRLEHEGLTEQIIGAGIDVHRELGPGFVESIYGNALALELHARSIPFERELHVPVLYRGTKVGSHRLDMFVFDEIVVELKALKTLNPDHFAIVRSHLRAVDREHGLLLNFSKPTLEIKRVLARR